METTKPRWAMTGDPGIFLGQCDLYDLYLADDLACLGYDVGKATIHTVEDLLSWGGLASELIRAHQSRAAQPAPAMSREQMIDAVSNVLSNYGAVLPSRAYRQFKEDVVDTLHPELKPKPAPVEPVKTETPEEMAERFIQPSEDRHYIVKRNGVAFGVSAGYEAIRAILAAIIREAQASALAAIAARDTAHAADLGNLRERCAVAGDEARRKGYDVGTHIRNVSLTAAPEARP